MPKSKKTNKPAEREVLYPEAKAFVCKGDKALTIPKIKQFLGWTTDKAEAAEAGVNLPTLRDEEGKDVYLLNNTGNRPFYKSNCRELVQKHLNLRWRFNGEPIIIGKTGQIENGQHSMVATVLAQQILDNPKSTHWKELHPSGKITLEKLVIVGIDETDDVVNTIDTGKRRTLEDVIYRSPYFKNFAPEDRRAASKILSYSVRFLWDRTGAKDDPFAPNPDYQELLDFVERHEDHLLAAAGHIAAENKENGVSKYLYPGYAAGLLYLMGCCSTDGERTGRGQLVDYDNSPGESALDWKYWEKAKAFWTLVARGDESMLEVVWALGKLVSQDDKIGAGKPVEKVAVFIKAWNYFKDQPKKSKMEGMRDAVQLEYYVDPEDGTKILINDPELGGIDLGPADKSRREKLVGGNDDEGKGVTEEQVEKAREELKAQAKREAQKAKLTAAAEAKKNGKGKVQGLTEAGKKAAAEQAKRGAGKPPPKPKTRETAAEREARRQEAIRADEELARSRDEEE